MSKIKYNTLHYIIALLKEYEIKNIIASPGSQNSTFNFICQQDKYFKCYSVVDERSAAYTALGLSEEINKPVVITCTGATAARNYMSALTEAYYRNIPIIALTFYNKISNKYNMEPQYTDRSISQNDIKDISITLPEIKNNEDIISVITNLNAVLSHAKYNKRPVHINCPSSFNYRNQTLPNPNNIWHTEYFYENYKKIKNEIKNKRTVIFIGEHKKFDKETENTISKFAKSYNIPVICDHISNYHGENKILISHYRIINLPLDMKPELIIDLGGISGIYDKGGLFNYAKEQWRITEHYEYKSRLNGRLTKLLIGREKTIFEELVNDCVLQDNYYERIKTEVNKITIPDLPFSLAFIAKELAKHIPENSILHLAILRALVNMNYFELAKSIKVTSNVGGFGIDGPLSTAAGISFADEKKKVFCLTGDLAFFYDMNILGNRHINNNLRILLENNNEGEAMREYNILGYYVNDKCKELISASGHYKSGAKGWAESCGFKYMKADTKQEFLSQINDFCNKDYDKPVIFEVFTDFEQNTNANNKLDEHFKNIFPREACTNKERFFSIKNEYQSYKKYKIIRILGTKFKFKAK